MRPSLDAFSLPHRTILLPLYLLFLISNSIAQPEEQIPGPNAPTSDAWAIEFLGPRDQQLALADNFASSFGLHNHGRIGELNIFLITLPESSLKRVENEQVVSLLTDLESSNAYYYPTHPLDEVEELLKLEPRPIVLQQNLRRSLNEVSLAKEMYSIVWVEKQLQEEVEHDSVFYELPKQELELTRRSHAAINSVSFSDEGFPSQYHHRPNFVNSTGAWELGVTGFGVLIGVVDSGVEYSHPDLNPNFNFEASHNYTQPDSFAHGTTVAGLAAARDDGTYCGVGVAFRAEFSSLPALTPNGNDAFSAMAISHMLQNHSIYTNSWGPTGEIGGSGTSRQSAMANGVRVGRGGLGNIFVYSSGNNGKDQSWRVGGTKTVTQDCGWNNNLSTRTSIGVGGVSTTLTRTNHEHCSAMLITAPGISLYSTDQWGSQGINTTGNCRNNNFSGTSGSTPIVSGTIALMLSANPGLGWLDVQRIIIETATQNDQSHPDWSVNGGGLLVHPRYSFGVINAGLAVEQAMKEIGKAPMTEIYLDHRLSFNQAWSPQSDGSIGFSTIIKVQEDILVHHVEFLTEGINTDAKKGHCAGLRLRDPSGFSSYLLFPKYNDRVVLPKRTLLSKSHWGVSSQGNWTIDMKEFRQMCLDFIPSSENVNDYLIGSGNTLSFSLRIWGTPTASYNTSVAYTFSSCIGTSQPTCFVSAPLPLAPISVIVSEPLPGSVAPPDSAEAPVESPSASSPAISPEIGPTAAESPISFIPVGESPLPSPSTEEPTEEPTEVPEGTPEVPSESSPVLEPFEPTEPVEVPPVVYGPPSELEPTSQPLAMESPSIPPTSSPDVLIISTPSNDVPSLLPTSEPTPEATPDSPPAEEPTEIIPLSPPEQTPETVVVIETPSAIPTENVPEDSPVAPPDSEAIPAVPPMESPSTPTSSPDVLIISTPSNDVPSLLPTSEPISEATPDSPPAEEPTEIIPLSPPEQTPETVVIIETPSAIPTENVPEDSPVAPPDSEAIPVVPPAGSPSESIPSSPPAISPEPTLVVSEPPPTLPPVDQNLPPTPEPTPTTAPALTPTEDQILLPASDPSISPTPDLEEPTATKSPTSPAPTGDSTLAPSQGSNPAVDPIASIPSPVLSEQPSAPAGPGNDSSSASNKKKSNVWWIVLVSVLGAAIVIGVVVAIVFASRRRGLDPHAYIKSKRDHFKL